MSDTVNFDTDRYNIDASDQGILQSQASWLARYPNKSVTIEGHCDERGTAGGEQLVHLGHLDLDQVWGGDWSAAL